MPSLHDELIAEKGGACKVCTYLSRLDPIEAAEWEVEIARPNPKGTGYDIPNTALVVALRRRKVNIEEASVRRHRLNHVAH
jgi:hypothetical protein